MIRRHQIIKNESSGKVFVTLLSFFVFSCITFAQGNRSSCLNFRAGYQVLMPPFKAQSNQIIDPFYAFSNGGRGYVLSAEGEKHFGNWFILGSFNFTTQYVIETILYNEYKISGLSYKFMPVHNLYVISPEVSLGRSFNLTDEIVLNLDAGIGFPFLLNKNSKQFAFRIYEVVSDKNSYFEMETSYFRKLPIQGNMRLQFDFPVKSNVLGLGCQYSLFQPVTTEYRFKKVVGMDYETYPQETSRLLNQAITFSVTYKFSLKKKNGK